MSDEWYQKLRAELDNKWIVISNLIAPQQGRYEWQARSGDGRIMSFVEDDPMSVPAIGEEINLTPWPMVTEPS